MQESNAYVTTNNTYKNNAHVPYEKQQYTRKIMISLYDYLPIIPSSYPCPPTERERERERERGGGGGILVFLFVCL